MSSREWREVKLGDVAMVKGGKRLPKGVNLLKEKNSHPYIRVRDLNNKKNLCFNSDFEYVDDETQKTISRYIVSTNDIIISIVGTIGLISKVDQSLNNANLTENCVKLINLLDIDCDFLYYYLVSDKGQNEIRKGTVGAVQAKLPLKNIQAINVILPTLSEQKAIGDTLSCLDDMIELNNRTNHLLEKIAQAIFKRWFVDFEFPNKDGEPYKSSGGIMVESELGEIPKGWRVVPFEDVINFQEGPGIRNWQYVLKDGTKFINIRCIQNKDLSLNTANMISNEEADGKYAHFLLNEWDIVVSTSGTLGRYAIVRKEHLPLCLNTSVIRFTPKTDFSHFAYMLGYISSDEFYQHLISKASGSVQANFGPMHLRQISLRYPSEDVLYNFHNAVFPLIKMGITVKSENQLLSKSRETLLPKLMSGEIRVSVKEVV